MKLSIDKQYKTQDGQPVRIICLDRIDSQWPGIGLYEIAPGCNEGILFINPQGQYSLPLQLVLPQNLIEVTPWGDFQIDEKVMVRSSAVEFWIRQHFAGISEGSKPMTWNNGYSSWTTYDNNDANKTSWTECRRPTPEGLA